MLQVVDEPKVTSEQHLLQMLASMANNTRAKLTMRWISSHSRVKGNEFFNKLAKEAAEGKASRRIDLPPTFRHGIPASIGNQARTHGIPQKAIESQLASLAMLAKVQTC
jgi:hypothetical protein